VTKKLLIASRIERVEQLSPRVKRFTVRPRHRMVFPPATPGSHALVRHGSGLLRSYSLCGPSEDTSTYQFAVLREDEGRGGSVAFHQSRVGEPIHVGYPAPSLPLQDSAQSHVFVAGGIGVTPFVPLAHEAINRGQRAILHYAVQTAADAAFLDTLNGIPDLELHLYVSAAGERLNVDALTSTLPGDAHMYVCGPPRLLEAVNASAQRHSCAARVHLESFSGLDASEAHSGEPFTVRLSLSKRTVNVPGDRSLLQALIDSGADVDSSCEGGVCGACRVTLLAGDAIHRDLCLTSRERDQNIITCVSRGTGTLTLHL
jgi:ferredoxin-NADP reductase